MYQWVGLLPILRIWNIYKSSNERLKLIRHYEVDIYKLWIKKFYTWNEHETT